MDSHNWLGVLWPRWWTQIDFGGHSWTGGDWCVVTFWTRFGHFCVWGFCHWFGWLSQVESSWDSFNPISWYNDDSTKMATIKRLHYTTNSIGIFKPLWSTNMRLLTTLGLISVMACRTDKSITIQNPAPKADIVSHNDGDVVLGVFQLFLWAVSPMPTTHPTNWPPFGMWMVT